MVVKVNVTVSSALCGDSAGYIIFSLPSDYLIGDLLKLYCSEKGIGAADDYILCGKGNAVLDPVKTLEEEHVHNDDNIQLTQSDKNEQLYAFGSWWMISLAALVIGSLGFAYSFYLFYDTQTLPQKYGLVIDAGSSHSQLFIFSWSQTEIENGGGWTDMELVHDCIMHGGIASFHSHVHDLPAYFSLCFREAEERVPLSARRDTPLILAATGGMRIFRAYDPEGADLVLSSILSLFQRETGFRTRVGDVFVASGQQEGISGWAAVNYLLQNFEAQDQEQEKEEAIIPTKEEGRTDSMGEEDDKKGEEYDEKGEEDDKKGEEYDKKGEEYDEKGEEYDEKDQVSALDLGGASVQVTTELSRNSSLWPTVNITIFNSTYRIYSKSFLCYGVGEAMHRYQYLLVRDSKYQSSPGVVLNPCLPTGFRMTITSADFSNPCILAANFSRDFSDFQFRPSRYTDKFAFKYFEGGRAEEEEEWRGREDYSHPNYPSNPSNYSSTSSNPSNFPSNYPSDSSPSTAMPTIPSTPPLSTSPPTSSPTPSTPPSPNPSVTTYILQGTSDTKSCRQKVKSLFDFDLCKANFANFPKSANLSNSTNPATSELDACLNQALIPPYKGELVGFSSLFHKLLPLLGVSSSESSLGEFEQAVGETCDMDARDLARRHPNISLTLLEDLCFDGTYVYTLLTEGLGVGERRWRKILFTNKVHEQEVVWAMGLMLNRSVTSSPELTTSSPALPKVNFCLLLSLFSLFVALSILFAWYAKSVRRRGNLYQRLFTRILDHP